MLGRVREDTPHPHATAGGDPFDAARRGDLPALCKHLDDGLPATACNDAGDSLLMLCAYHGSAEAVTTLLRRGADPDACNAKGQHPLTGASYKGDRHVVQALLEGGASCEGTLEAARSPLMYAAMYNHAPVVRLLLAHGADPTRTDGKGKTALDLAREMRAVYTIELLEDAAGG